MSTRNVRKRTLVASMAGVSESTVSRVFNKPQTVSDRRREKVFRAAEYYGYFPDKYASALRRNGTGIIIFLEVKSASGYRWTDIRQHNWFYGEIVRSLAFDIEKTMFHLQFKTVSSPAEVKMIGKKRMCDGIIAFNVENHETIRSLIDTGIPYVACHHLDDREDIDYCVTDNYAGGRSAGEIIKRNGGSNPVYITGNMEEYSHIRRTEGFLSLFPDSECVHVPVGIEGGICAAERIYPSVRRQKIDSIGVVNDLTAIGLVKKLADFGVRIPRDVILIGYDNIPSLIALPVRLATFELALGQIYSYALKALIEKIHNRMKIGIRIPPRYIPGESVLDLASLPS